MSESHYCSDKYCLEQNENFVQSWSTGDESVRERMNPLLILISHHKKLGSSGKRDVAAKKFVSKVSSIWPFLGWSILMLCIFDLALSEYHAIHINKCNISIICSVSISIKNPPCIPIGEIKFMARFQLLWWSGEYCSAKIQSTKGKALCYDIWRVLCFPGIPKSAQKFSDSQILRLDNVVI